MTRKLLLATANRKKLEEMRAILAPSGIEVVAAGDFPDVETPEETGATFAENARQKALWYAQRTGLPALADDSGLVVDALDGRPGVFSSRYAPTDAERIARLLAELGSIADPNRTARFVCAMVLADGDHVVASAEGRLEGAIGHEPRGSFGFGYDPVFAVPQVGRHLAEIPAEQKNQLSHRANAIAAILPEILKYFGLASETCGYAAS